MSGTSKGTSNTNYGSAQEPWAQAKPALQGILSGIQTQLPNYQANPLEQQAISQLTANSQALPNWAPQAEDLTNKYLTGDPSGLLNTAYADYNRRLSPIADQNNDPTKTPGMQALLDTIRGDISNQVNGQFAGAGRDLSGLNQQALGRGISQGLAAPLLAQYNQNVGAQGAAAGNLYQAAGGTDAALTGNRQAGLGFANTIPALTNASPMGVLSAQGMSRSLPLQNLGMLENLTVPIAGLGGTNQGYSNTTTTQTMSPWQQAMQAAGLFSGQFSPVSGIASAAQGGAGKLPGLLSMFG